MPHRPTIWKRCALLLVLTMLLGLGSRSDAAVREYAVISIKIGAGESTSSNTGTLVFELWPDLAPKTVQNFKHLANTRFYDGTASHRLISGFMIQAGDPNTRSNANVKFFGQGGPGHTIPDELAKQSDASWEKRKHVRGILSMAHSNTSERNNTGGSQFFVMFGNASHLDGVHASFGILTQGSEFMSKLEELPKFAKDTTAFDFNQNGIFDDSEKQLILGAASGNETVLKSLVGKSQDQELTAEDRALVSVALGGFTDIDGDGFLSESELNTQQNMSPHKADQPIEPVEIQSIKVLATEADPNPTFPFQTTTHSGLLRAPDRSLISGCYQISVLSTGAVSGVVEYLARKVSFTTQPILSVSGSLLSGNDVRMAVLQGTIDSSSPSPLLLDIKLHKAYSPDGNENAISVELSDKSRSPLAYGFSSSPSKAGKSALARQYTMCAQTAAVSSFTSNQGWINDTTSISGHSAFLIRVNPNLCISYVTGKFANGTPYTTSRFISSEHGANILPLFSYVLPPFLEGQRSIFPTLDLTRTPSTSYQTPSLDELTFLNTTSLGFGSVELAQKNSTTAAPGNLLWMHPSTNASNAPLKSRYRVNTVTYTTPWTPPARNTVMKPFSQTPPRGQLIINGNSFNFSLMRNTTAVFDQPSTPAKPVLTFDPATGAFSGIFNDISSPPTRRRIFSGVLLNSTNASGGLGFFVDSNSSKGIRILTNP